MNHDQEIELVLARCVADAMKNAHSAEDVKKRSDATARAFHRVLAAFQSEWNTRNSSVLSSFPDEVLLHCISLLPLHDRVSASVVCRRWRRVALHPSLCGSLVVPQDIFNRDYYTDLLPILLSHSGSAPLDLYLDLTNGPGKWGSNFRHVYWLIEDNMHRLRTLELNNIFSLEKNKEDFNGKVQEPFRMNGLSAPLLETLNVTAPLDDLPNAPLLRSLTVTSLDLSKCPVLPSLREFIRHDLDYYKTNRDCSLAFKRFPNLKTFRYTGSLYIDSLPQPPFPATLENLELGPDYTATQYLQSYHGCSSLRTVQLENFRYLQSGLDLFFSLRPAIHDLVFMGSYIEFRASDFSVKITYWCTEDPLKFSEIDNIGACFATVETLTIETLHHVALLAGMNLSFPSLKELRVHPLYTKRKHDGRRIVIPRSCLLNLCFTCSDIDCDECDSPEWEANPLKPLRRIAAFWEEMATGLPLETLTLSGLPLHWPEDLDVSPLLSIGRNIRTDKGVVLHRSSADE